MVSQAAVFEHLHRLEREDCHGKTADESHGASGNSACRVARDSRGRGGGGGAGRRGGHGDVGVGRAAGGSRVAGGGDRDGSRSVGCRVGRDSGVPRRRARASRAGGRAGRVAGGGRG